MSYTVWVTVTPFAWEGFEPLASAREELRFPNDMSADRLGERF